MGTVRGWEEQHRCTRFPEPAGGEAGMAKSGMKRKARAGQLRVGATCPGLARGYGTGGRRGLKEPRAGAG